MLALWLTELFASVLDLWTKSLGLTWRQLFAEFCVLCKMKRDSFISQWCKSTEKQLKFLILFYLNIKTVLYFRHVIRSFGNCCLQSVSGSGTFISALHTSTKSMCLSWLSLSKTLTYPPHCCCYGNPLITIPPLAVSVGLVWWHVRHKGHSGD